MPCSYCLPMSIYNELKIQLYTSILTSGKNYLEAGAVTVPASCYVPWLINLH